ncbi:hypothetical protein OQ790_24040, partial [Mycobacterium ulcerans]|nr:hypothetical protein [Mycobacterium ulcerans]MEB4467170.1 hypothetical protein [Mycobacterium ulcerans]
PPPRPPQSTIPQLTSLLINNAGALRLRVQAPGSRQRRRGPTWQRVKRMQLPCQLLRRQRRSTPGLSLS